MTAKVLLSVKIPPEHLVGLEKLALKDDRPLPEYVRELIRGHLRTEPTVAPPEGEETR